MEENASGTESEQTDDSSQDEFESIEDGGDVGTSHVAYEDDSFEPYTDELLADED